MIAPFVVDASVAVAWVHPAQSTVETDLMLGALGAGARVFAPAIWPLEVSNGLLALVRRGKLLEQRRLAALQQLASFAVSIDSEAPSLAWSTLPTLAATHGLSVHDAAYLELAMRRRVKLACKDGPLQAAAKRAGLTVWSGN